MHTGSPLPDPWNARLQALAMKRLDASQVRAIAPLAGLDFCSNDYLGLRRDPRLAQAALDGAILWGSGSGGARLLRGTSPLHDQLESELAQLKGQESALLFNTGYQCNATVIPSLVQKGDAVFSDALNHASLVDGCRFARQGGADVFVYRHLDLQDLEAQLKKWRIQSAHGLALVVTDAIFSMDGDAADLAGVLDICERYDGLLMVDEAHATGLVGPGGAGLASHQGLSGRIPLVMGTLGKALGTFGAFVACPKLLRDHFINTCRGFIFSTALPPSLVAASLEALHLSRLEGWRRDKALGFAFELREALGLKHHPSAIVPILLGSNENALEAARTLQKEGFDVRAVRYPTVPHGQARLRITTGAHQEEGDVQRLKSLLMGMLRDI